MIKFFNFNLIVNINWDCIFIAPNDKRINLEYDMKVKDKASSTRNMIVDPIITYEKKLILHYLYNNDYQEIGIKISVIIIF